MNVPVFFSMSVMKNNHITCTKDYFCTLTISFHQFVWKRKPTMISILHGAAWLLLNCIANRSNDSGIPKTSIDYTCIKYKDPEPV